MATIIRGILYYIPFADSTRVPRFKFAEMQNHTVRVGSEATFACIVEQLGTYKVYMHLILFLIKFLKNKIRWHGSIRKRGR